MAIPVYDYRNDVRNVLVTPEIRSRFLRMEPGQEAALHSHDLGHEVFLVLEGRAAFEVEGETVVLGPGQMCAVLAHQAHRVRVVGDAPMTMYLSVTPHVQPTHTGRTEEGGRLPLRFMPSSAYDLPESPAPVEELLERHAAAARAVAEAAAASARVQQEMADEARAALAAGDRAGAERARAAMWDAFYALHQSVSAMDEVWNMLAPRCPEAE